MSSSGGGSIVGGTMRQSAPSQSILSEKVARALQVRTDTPAMKAALDALSNLQPTSSSTSTTGTGSSSAVVVGAGVGGVVDSRSVRVAIEQDALNQALLLQNELRALVSTVRELRRSIDETAACAHRVKQAIHSNVIVTSDATSTVLASSSSGAIHGTSSADAGGDNNNEDGIAGVGGEYDPSTLGEGGADGSTSAGAAGTSTTLNSLEQEQKLAAVLADAFAHRSVARQRLEAVHAFLETFDLSQQDSRLLDHYNFEDIDGSTTAMMMHHDGSAGGFDEDGNNNSELASFPNGLAFLRALERVRKIRRALAQTFGGSSGSGPGGTDTLSLLDSGGTGQTTIGGLGASSALRMMENLAQKQERAYERLYHWLQKYLNAFTSGGTSGGSNPQEYDERLDVALQHAFVQRSLYTLRHVPAFYSHTLELIGTSRRTEETKRFLLALTSGYGGMPPLEMKSHDSVAYVGDMLAFSFQAFSVEADVAKGLLLYVPPEELEQNGTGAGDGQDDDGERAEDDGDVKERHDGGDDEYWLLAEDKPMTAPDMLAVSMSGLSRPLKSRILQVVSTLARRNERMLNIGGGLNDSSNNVNDADSDDGMIGAVDSDDLDEEGLATRVRLSHLYDICGLLLFYRSVVQKSVEKLQQQQRAHEQRKSKRSSNKDRRSSSSGNDGTEDEQQQQQDDPSSSNPLLNCINECLIEGTKAFEATIRVYCAMLSTISSMTGESEAALAHSLLVRLADVRMRSPGFSKDVDCPPECRRTLSMEWITEALTDAALQVCKTLDDTVVLKQLVSVSKKSGTSVLAAEMLDENIDRKEIELIDHLVQSESAKVLDLCGLGSIASAWMRWQEQQQDGATDEDTVFLMSSYPGLSHEEVESSMKEFYASLYSPPLPSLETLIKDPVLRKTARTKIAAKVCDVYGDLYDSIQSSGKGGYDDIRFLGHGPDQVRTLFSA